MFADEKTAVADAEKRAPEDPAAIAYLKEQQWTNEFGTMPCGKRSCGPRFVSRRPFIRSPEARRSLRRLPRGDLPPTRSSRSALSSAPARPWACWSRDSARAATIAPRLPRRSREAQAGLEAARAEQARAERLLAERAVPARRVEEAQARGDGRRSSAASGAGATGAARRDARNGGGAAAGNAFVLRAPLAGRVAEVIATLGASYDEGAPLFRIVQTDESSCRRSCRLPMSP